MVNPTSSGRFQKLATVQVSLFRVVIRWTADVNAFESAAGVEAVLQTDTHLEAEDHQSAPTFLLHRVRFPTV